MGRKFKEGDIVTLRHSFSLMSARPYMNRFPKELKELVHSRNPFKKIAYATSFGSNELPVGSVGVVKGYGKIFMSRYDAYRVSETTPKELDRAREKYGELYGPWKHDTHELFYVDLSDTYLYLFIDGQMVGVDVHDVRFIELAENTKKRLSIAKITVPVTLTLRDVSEHEIDRAAADLARKLNRASSSLSTNVVPRGSCSVSLGAAIVERPDATHAPKEAIVDDQDSGSSGQA